MVALQRRLLAGADHPPRLGVIAEWGVRACVERPGERGAATGSRRGQRALGCELLRSPFDAARHQPCNCPCHHRDHRPETAATSFTGWNQGFPPNGFETTVPRRMAPKRNWSPSARAIVRYLRDATS